ncbi:unnamed protein product [Pylaiella littoralis]
MPPFLPAKASSQLVVAASLVSAALLLLLVVTSDLFTPPPTATTTTTPTTLMASQQRHEHERISPQRQHRYRAHEVDAATAAATRGAGAGGASGGIFRRSSPKHLKKFVLQESISSGGGGGSSVSEHDGQSSWRTLGFREVAGLWKSGQGEFVETFVSSITDLPFEAVFWESIPVTRDTQDKPYEYVMVDSPRLAAVAADGSAFAAHLASGKGTNEVVSFRNLRKDARLVVPCEAEQERGANYAHLATFVRTAPREQVVKFFGAVGEALEMEIASRNDESPVWLSTSGLGVYWLHARLDAVPKYYTHTPYTTL